MKYSRQREQILEYVESVRNHPTAETVYNEIRKKNPNISLGTVYRNLELLSNQGKIKRIKLKNFKDCFDGDISNHYHAVCQKCGKIEDVWIKLPDDIDIKVQDILHQKIVSHDIIFNTICKDCDK